MHAYTSGERVAPQSYIIPPETKITILKKNRIHFFWVIKKIIKKIRFPTHSSVLQTLVVVVVCVCSFESTPITYNSLLLLLLETCNKCLDLFNELPRVALIAQGVICPVDDVRHHHLRGAHFAFPSVTLMLSSLSAFWVLGRPVWVCMFVVC